MGTFRRICGPLLVVAFSAFAPRWRGSRPELAVVDALAAGAMLSMTPDLDVSMSFGDVDVIVWSVVASAFAAPPVAACLLAVAAAIELYPIRALIVVMLRFPDARARSSRRRRPPCGSS